MNQSNISARVKQIHHTYLDVEYQLDYYGYVRDRTTRYARHLDFAIGLGAVGSGGSGLGILGDPMFAWLCGVLTSVSVIVAIAKSNYDWHGRIAKCTELMEFFRNIATQYKYLIDDLNYYQDLHSDLEAQHLKLRNDYLNSPPDPYPKLKEKEKELVQDMTLRRIDRRAWWSG